jgi:hypothetical protein
MSTRSDRSEDAMVRRPQLTRDQVKAPVSQNFFKKSRGILSIACMNPGIVTSKPLDSSHRSACTMVYPPLIDKMVRLLRDAKFSINSVFLDKEAEYLLHRAILTVLTTTG